MYALTFSPQAGRWSFSGQDLSFTGQGLTQKLDSYFQVMASFIFFYTEKYVITVWAFQQSYGDRFIVLFFVCKSNPWSFIFQFFKMKSTVKQIQINYNPSTENNYHVVYFSPLFSPYACGSQSEVQGPLGFLRQPQSQNYFHYNTKMLLACLTLSEWTKKFQRLHDTC